MYDCTDSLCNEIAAGYHRQEEMVEVILKTANVIKLDEK